MFSFLLQTYHLLTIFNIRTYVNIFDYCLVIYVLYLFTRLLFNRFPPFGLPVVLCYELECSLVPLCLVSSLLYGKV